MDVVGLDLKGKILKMLETVEGKVFLEKEIEDLEVFMDWPDHLQYFSRQEFIQLASEMLALPKMSRLSANKRWCISKQFLEILRPFMEPTLSAVNSSLERILEPMIRRKGERGSPCLRPFLGKMQPKGLQFNKIEKEAKEMHNLI